MVLNAGPEQPATSFVPSAEQATEVHAITGVLFDVQVKPESVDVTIIPLYATATSRVPSAEQATDRQLVFELTVKTIGDVIVQEAPKFVVTYMAPLWPAAMILEPSAEQATFG